MLPQQESAGTPASVGLALEQGAVHLRRREWRPAQDLFKQALEADPGSPAGWEGLATSALCLDDAATSRSANERAYREYLERDDFRGAARVAIQLALYHDAYRGESAIASGWFERARRLLETVPAAADHAWLAFWRAHIDIHIHGEVARGEPSLADAIRRNDACKVGELDLMTRGLRGLMAISEGAIDEGLRRLDEATTEVVAGEPLSPQIVGWTYCYVLDACESARDFDRASQWIERAFEAVRDFDIEFSSGACRSHYVGILTWRGDYPGTEREIEMMRREVGGVSPVYRAFCDVRLGEIRRRQGRLDEAAALLEPVLAHLPAMLGLAAVALDRGQPQTTVDLVERYFRRISRDDQLRRLHGLELLVPAYLQLRDVDRARAALEECQRIASRSATPLMRAAAQELAALVAAAAGGSSGDLDAARRLFEDAIDGYDLTGSPYEAAAARLRLGDVLAALRRVEPARKVFEAARAGAERLGAGRLAKQAVEALEKLQTSTEPSEAASGVLTPREVEVLALVAQGISNQEIGDRLFISAFTVKRHIANILTKLDLPTRAAAAAYAIREGLAR
jgi:DNA-binding NarL/FixJ family response regulator